jgi:hypothetical protein
MHKLLILVWFCESFLWGGKIATTQQAELVVSPRASATATRLLFPFAGSHDDFETEITISNTSQDTSGTAPQAGTCTVNYYGLGAPPASTSRSITAGTQLIFKLSEGGGGILAAADFEGYVIADCGFPLARGTAKLYQAGHAGFSNEAQIITLPRSTGRRQSLLFPFITSQGGFDSRIAIANTSADPFGSSPSSGSCALYFYGANAPAVVTTAIISPGAVYTTSASTMAAGFQGYVIADCSFAGASGTGFVSDSGAHAAFSENAELLDGPREITRRPLLFSSVKNQNGLDTTILIANTSLDLFGTAATSGLCTLSFYGANAPSPVSTGDIPAGFVYSTPVSVLAPGFEGYVVAACSFPHSRGFSFTNSRGAVRTHGGMAWDLTTPRSITPSSLLFNAVTNRDGADTSIVIANTSQDPFGTSQSGGKCAISYFGDMADGGSVPPSSVSTDIQPGTELSFSLSQGNPAAGIAATPGFRGYLIADCRFPLARGSATTAVDASASTASKIPGPVRVTGGGGKRTGSPTATPTLSSRQRQASALAVSSAELRFVPVTPCRVADTRNSTGPFGGPPIPGGATRDFTIPNSTCGIPATAQAYSLNVAVVPAGPLGYLTLWPSGQTQPVASTLNSLDGRIKSNAAIVPAGTGGAISAFASNATDIVLDINGYFVPATDPTALAFYPVTPCRVADTRNATAPLGGPALIGGQSRPFPILSASACNIPSSAQAYSLNFAAVPKGPLGYMTAWPTGQSQPAASSLNALTGTVTSNAVIVPAGVGGAINVFASNSTDLVIDVNGYFAPMAPGGLSLYNATPCRVLDTRQPPGSAPFSGKLDVNIAATACSIPASAQAFVLSATVVPPGALGIMTLWPQGQTQPVASTLNALDGAITSNLVITSATNGVISVFASNPTHLILDVLAYFAP